MCVVSMIGDHYGEKWEPWKKAGGVAPNSFPPFPSTYPTQLAPSPLPTRADFDRLREEVKEMKELLKKAIEYDRKNNEPHCEQEDKMRFLRQVAESVGVNLDDVLGKSAL